MLGSFISPLLELLADTLFFWIPSRNKHSPDIAQACKTHDGTLIDSTSDLLLVKTKQGLYLISRHQPWKTKLTTVDEKTYLQKGKRSLVQIHEKHQNPEIFFEQT